VLTVLKVPDDVPIENKRVTGAIASAQGQVESQNFETRKNILKYDDVMSRQREVIYEERRRVLEGADLHEQVRSMVDDVTDAYVVAATEGFPEEWDLDQLWVALKTLYPISLTIDALEDEVGDRAGWSRELLAEEIKSDAQSAYDQREAELGSEVMRELERRVMLSVLDRKWREHLYEMDYLREGIGLRAYSQRDPLVEYQREGFELFTTMMDGIKEESVGFLFNLEVQIQPSQVDEPASAATGVQEAPQSAAVGAGPRSGREPEPTRVDGVSPGEPSIVAGGLATRSAPATLSYSSPSVDGDAETDQRSQSTVAAAEDMYAGTPRNAPCPCGSGRKYKRCHGDPSKRNA
jgi:preprotein translocase subunit SecA